MYRVCVQNGSSHETLIEGTFLECEEVYNTYAGKGIVYMQIHCSHVHILNSVLAGYWTLVKER